MNLIKEILVQIGANRGEKEDPLYKYLINKDLEDIFIVLIEPHPGARKELEKNYNWVPNKIILDLAIADYNGTIKLFMDNADKGVSCHSSTLFNHLLVHKHSVDVISEAEVECLLLDTMIERLKELSISKIDWLLIDTEGYDAKILLSSSLTSLPIYKITWETIHADGPFKKDTLYFKTLEHLNKKGYRLLKRDNCDETWIK